MSFDTGIFIDTDDSTTIPDPRVVALAAAIKLPFYAGRFWEDCRTMEDPDSNRKFDIYSRSKTSRNGTVGTGGWTDGTTTTSLPVTSSAGLTVGMVLKVEDEYVIVSGTPSSTTINVFARGAGGTTGATHTADTDYTVVGSAINDTDLKNVTSIHESTSDYTNYMQTVAEVIDYTRGGLLDPRQGLKQSMVNTLEEEAFLRAVESIQKSSILGKKQAGGTNSPWMTAGLLQQLSDTTDSRLVLTYGAGSAAITEAKLKAALRLVTNQGRPTDIYCSSTNKDVFNSFVGSAASTTVRMNTEMANTQAGYYVNRYDYEGLILNVKIDSNMPDDQIAIVNADKCYKGWKKGDELRLNEEPKESSREYKSSFNGSFGVAVEDVGYEHILITGIVP